MRIITNDEYEKLQHKPVSIKKVDESFFHKTNNEAASILDAKNIPDDIKLQLYGSVMTAVKNQLNEILNRPLNLNLSVSKSGETPSLGSLSLSSSPLGTAFQTPSASPEKFNSPFKGTITNPVELTVNDSRLLNSVPDNFKAKTLELLRILKQFNEFISWDVTGRVTFFGNEFVENSNLVDLLTFSLRDVKFDQPPPGVNRFIRILKLINVPQNILSREAKKGFIGDLHQIPVREGNSRISGFQFWNPVLSGDRHTQTPKTSRNVTFRNKRH